MIRIPRPLGTLTFLLAWLVPWRPAFRVQPKNSKLRFLVHWRDMTGRHIAKYGVYEPGLTQWISKHLASSSRGIFVDVGANVGWHSLHAALHDSVESVIAFEPDAFNAWLLDRNLTLNGIDKVIINNCAVGKECGVVRLNRYKSSNYGRHSVLTDHGYGSRIVPITDLDAALRALGFSNCRIAILKIDVEGYEPAVVSGAMQTLARTDVVIIEHSPALSQSGGLSAADMVDSLYAAGLTPHRLSNEGHIITITPGDLKNLEGVVDVIWTRTPNAATGPRAAPAVWRKPMFFATQAFALQTNGREFRFGSKAEVTPLHWDVSFAS
jgi:FkbM family methyltransferase